jgi:DNA-binding response OmpR family regulator
MFSGRPVLIADDSPVVRLSVARRVRAAGLAVLERDSAASAGAVDAASIACALLDLDLGDGYGTDVAERLREAKESLPIAFFTSTRAGTPNDEKLERAAALGPVFAKPDDLDAAVAWVEKNA